MIPDAHTPCPACPAPVRALYAVARRVLAGTHSHFLTHERLAPAEYEELYQACEDLRPWIDAHHANQEHSLSPELEAARHPVLSVIVSTEGA